MLKQDRKENVKSTELKSIEKAYGCRFLLQIYIFEQNLFFNIPDKSIQRQGPYYTNSFSFCDKYNREVNILLCAHLKTIPQSWL